MLKIDRKNKALEALPKPTLSEADITERYDLQECIFNSPEAFFGEINQELFLVGKEICPSSDVLDRIDLLALDQDGNAVIIELKRGNKKYQLLQAISYAGMIAKWTPDDFFSNVNVEDAEKLADYLGVEKEEINRSQRIILIAEGFDYSILVAAEWLSEQYGVDIACCRVSLAKDSTSEYLVCSHIFPNPQLVQVAVQRRQKKKGIVEHWKNWEEALSVVTNQEVVDFFRRELDAKQWNYLQRRTLKYRVNGDHRLTLRARNKFAYGIQYGRFNGDIELWRNGLEKAETVEELNQGVSIRFRLFTKSDFVFFYENATKRLSGVSWSDQSPYDGAEEEAE